jgi:DNA anti-recombination protein RmuC
VPEDTREPQWESQEPERGAGPPDLRERLRERIAAARRSVDASLEDVLAELEREETALYGEPAEGMESPPQERIEAAAEQAAEQAVQRLARELGEQLAHVDRALILIGESERRMIGLSDRIEEAGRTVVRALDSATQLVDWEQRIGSAVDVEAEVADRIVAAERRLRDLSGGE